MSFKTWMSSLNSEYRQIFTVVFSLNLAGVVWFLYNWYVGESRNEDTCALATSINLAVSIVIREEHVVNLLYTIFAAIPQTAPLWIRRRAGKIYHLGGLHSGCAVAATFWFILYSVENTIIFVNKTTRDAESWTILFITFILDTLLIAMLVMAHPSLRNKLHDYFEMVHRFAGWSSLGLLWTLTVLDLDSKRGSKSLASAIFSNANIWLLFISTISICITWLNCRKVNVRSELLSSHALRIHFDYTTPQPGTTIRISNSPLCEWHAFATWAQPGMNGFSLIISNAGDFTGKLIQNPPTSVYARRKPTCGVLRIAPMFRSILLVATGSGIAPCLPVLMAQRTRINLFWSTRNPLTTYGTEIGSIIEKLGKSAFIHDTTTMGRPTMLPQVLQLYRETESEAVIVISNPGLTIKLVQDLEALGVPAFGPIWDS